MTRPTGTVVLIAALILSALLAPLAAADPVPGTRGGDSWDPGGFEANLLLEYTPSEPKDRDTVTVRIEALNDTAIIDAVLDLQVNGAYQGGISFFPAREDLTAATAVIPGHPRGARITFNVTAWDARYVRLTSQDISYVVQGSGLGWRYETFQENVLVNVSERRPEPWEPVQVTITGTDGVVLTSGILWIVYELPDRGNSSGAIPFRTLNASALVADIPGYPLGTRVEYWIHVSDADNVTMESPIYAYGVTLRAFDYPREPFPVAWDFAGPAAALVILPLLLLQLWRRRRREGAS